MKINKQE